MKKLLLVFLILSYQQNAFAQGVGINTNTPDPSAALDIQSSNKGLLVPRVALGSLSDNSTVSNPAHALLVFNTTDNVALNPGYYYNEGTAASPSWRPINDLSIPYYNATSTGGAAFQIDNYNGSSGGIALKGYNVGVGTGVYAQSDNGYALKVDGNLRIFGNGQIPGAGKVLTSDNNGAATWQNAPKLPDVAFSASTSAAVAQVPYNIPKQVPFDLESYDLGNNYDPATSIFTAPVKGIYHFDVQVAFRGDEDNPTDDYGSNIRLLGTEHQNDITNSYSTKNAHNISCDVILQQGNQIQVSYFHTLQNGFIHIEEADSYGADTYFNGRLVTKL
ncbi:MAG: hypothetical protein ABIN80_24345 [Dyadobacter sp.]|uniref:C1q-like domain-containing protein n=1 Tax=Dyadobacter sp. TaxID=1914288 RepID=UPI003267DF79